MPQVVQLLQEIGDKFGVPLGSEKAMGLLGRFHRAHQQVLELADGAAQGEANI